MFFYIRNRAVKFLAIACFFGSLIIDFEKPITVRVGRSRSELVIELNNTKFIEFLKSLSPR